MLLGQDVASGFVNAKQNVVASASDADCSAKCTAQPECTAWIRQPSINVCYMSRQTGTVSFKHADDRNAGRRCQQGAWTIVDRSIACVV